MLSREERIKRIISAGSFRVIRNAPEELLWQALRIAGTIRYFTPGGEPDGYMDELLERMNSQLEKGNFPEPDGNMEPSQAILYTFIHHLHTITGTFNKKWNEIGTWYWKEYAGIETLPVVPDNVWVKFEKNTSLPVFLEKGTGFYYEDKDEQRYIYRLQENISIENVRIAHIYSLWYERRKDIRPAGRLNYITALKYQDLTEKTEKEENLFGRQEGFSKAVGIIINHPALVLKEGKRNITLLLHAENNEWIQELDRVASCLINEQEFRSREKTYFELFNNLFYLTISTEEGWSVISGSVVTREEEQLKIQFILTQEFPSTLACTPDIHQQETPWPALRIYPNFDAWLYPYSWLSLFRLHKITIRCQVENIRNLQLYNELGHIDNSSSFYPFGTNTGKGAWFIAGNYEMAIKDTTGIALHIHWSGLPEDPDGLQGYYKEYEREITNRSFRVAAQYLSDYNWYPVSGQPSFYLFSSQRKCPDDTPLPAAPLAGSSILTPINIERMPLVKELPEVYEYSIRSRTGFIKFILQEPEIGFGEKEYYQLFSERMMENTWKKKKVSLPQPPVSPVVEKMSLDYYSESIIDLRNKNEKENIYVHQLHPLGIVPATTFLYSLDTDANLLIALSEVEGGEVLSLFFCFYPVGRASSSAELPVITWYWGDGYEWEEMSPAALLTDSTSNFMTSGEVKIRLPEVIYPEQYDRKHHFWLRAGISKNMHLVSGLHSISVNTARLIQDVEEKGSELWNGEITPEAFIPEKKLPGIEGIYPVTPLYGGVTKENDTDLQIRVSEYVSHRGRAVLASDYEQITLQAFPDIVAVKCISDFDGKQYNKGTIALLIIPDRTETETPDSPMATSYMLLKVREEMKKYISGYVKELIVINPVYREIMIRCGLTFRSGISLPVAKARLEELFQWWIAPWQKKKQLPQLEKSLSLSELFKQITEQDFIAEIRYLTAISLINETGEYTINEYRTNKESILPALPHVVYIPAKEHTIHIMDYSTLGINEMKIDNNLIID